MQTIVIDSHTFAIELAGFDQPLRVAMQARSGSETYEIVLPPWSCGRHLNSLRRHLHAAGRRLALDSAGYADDVLDRAQVPASQRTALRPLALWWARGLAPGDQDGEQDDTALRPDVRGRVMLRPGLWAHLRPWTWGERLAAQRARLASAAPRAAVPEAASAGTLGFDPVGYLESMLAASLVHLEAETGAAVRVDALDAQATRRLLAAVGALNHPAAGVDDPLAVLPPALAAATLRLCATMGWTLDQVLARPSSEVARLLALLERAEAAGSAGAEMAAPRTSTVASRPSVPRRSSLADHPDAVVIVFGDEAGEIS